MLAADPMAARAERDGGRRILVVDDERITVEALARHLEADGFVAGRAYSGEEALAALDERPFDLVILDVGLPGTSGFDVCRRIRASGDLPIIFLIENNEIAMGTRLEHHAADTELYKRGLAFDIKCERLDGMDVVQVSKDAQRIVEWVRKNQKPYLVEVMNYRFSGHGAADHDRQLYRTKEEEEEAMTRDPIVRHERFMLKNKMMTRETMEAIEEETAEWVEDVYEKADASPVPDPDEVYDNVYSDIDPEKGH